MNRTRTSLFFILFISQLMLNNAWSTNQYIIERQTILAHRTLQTAKPMDFPDCIRSQGGGIRHDFDVIQNVITSDHPTWQKVHYFIKVGRKFNTIFIPGQTVSISSDGVFMKRSLELINIPEIYMENTAQIMGSSWKKSAFLVIQQLIESICYTPEVEAYMLNTPEVPHYDFDRTEKVMPQLNTIPSEKVPTVLALFDDCLSDDLITWLRGAATLQTIAPSIDHLVAAIAHATTNPNLTFNEPTPPEEIAYLRPRGERASHRLKNLNSYLELIYCAQPLPTEVIRIITDVLLLVDQPKKNENAS